MDEGRLAALVSDGCESFSVPGAQVGLVRGAERVVVCSGTRAASTSAPVERSTAFHAGSLAKSLTALVVVDAARRGEVDLDVPCDEQAPGLWDDTPRALMAQTTGRPNVLPEQDEDAASFVERVGAMPRVHAPGRFSYCNAGWPVLDVLLRHRTGSGFEDLAVERVLGGAAAFGQPTDSAEGHGVGAGTPVHPVPGQYAASATTAGSRWWASADRLLDYARLHLDDGGGRFDERDVQELRRRHAVVPGATVSDGWGLGWALWDRGEHRAFGWAGFTGGHRAYLRCFPDQDAALVVLANCAGPLFGPPGGSALFDSMLPDLLELLDVPPLAEPTRTGGRGAAAVAGGYGPLTLGVGTAADTLVLDAAAFGESEPLTLRGAGGDTYVVAGDPPGAMPVAVDGDLLYLGPFAVPRNR